MTAQPGTTEKKRRRLRSRLLLIGLPLLLLPLLFLICVPRPQLAPEEAILDEEVAALTKLVARARAGPILNEQEALIVVEGRLLEGLLTAALPIETVVGGKYAVRLDSARVSLEDGLALVRLGGRATLVGQPVDESFADATVYGALDDLAFDPDEGVLRGRIRVIGFDAGRIRLFNNENANVRRTVVGLSRLQLGAFDELNYTVEIPVQLGRSITLPEVGPEGGVHIAKAELPLSVAVASVEAFQGRLWVSARAAAREDTSIAADVTDSLSAPSAKKRKKVPHQALAIATARRNGLRDSVTALLEGDPVVRAARDDSTGVLVILPEPLLQSLVRSVAAIYLERVDLNITEELTTRQTGNIRVSTPFGKVNAGTWTLNVATHGIAGVLRHEAPRISLASGSRLKLEILARIEGGSGSATLDFHWDPTRLASLLCHEFRLQRTLDAIVTPQEHLITGSLRIAANEQSLTAYPEFVEEKFPIQFDMTEASWDTIRAALDAQDHLFKCGAVMDPNDILERLERLGQAGIRIRLPAVVFRKFNLPASVTKSVRIAGRPVALSVSPREVRTRGKALWYGASIGIAGGEAPPKASTPSQ